MTAGLCVCVVLAVLCTSCLGLPFSSAQLHAAGQRTVSAPAQGKTPGGTCRETPSILHLTPSSLSLSPRRAALLEADVQTLEETHDQHRRSAPQLKASSLDDADSRANLSELLARLISSRKGEDFRVCVYLSSRLSSFGADG